ncbi:hypothetical protein ACFLTG_01615 [Chloroflexota bacterium]
MVCAAVGFSFYGGFATGVIASPSQKGEAISQYVIVSERYNLIDCIVRLRLLRRYAPRNDRACRGIKADGVTR